MVDPKVERNGSRNQSEMTLRRSVNENGTGASLPPGWTVVRNVAGSYTVTPPFSLDTAKWCVVVTAVNADQQQVNNMFKTASAFSVIATNFSNQALDTAFDFIYSH